MKRLIIFFIFALPNAHAGLFGPSTYEECALQGLKDATNSASTQLLNKVCRDKFKKEGGNIVSECSVTWNGNTFRAGKPEDVEKYTQIIFYKTADSIFIPNSLMKSVTQTFIKKEKQKIQSICPAITLEEPGRK